MNKNSLSTSITIGALFTKSIGLVLCKLLVVFYPIAVRTFLQWFTKHLIMPHGERIQFVGKLRTGSMWANLLMIAIADYYAGFSPFPFGLLVLPITVGLTLNVVRWYISNLEINGRILPLKFTGGYWEYLGWSLLCTVSILSIIGWAWAYTAFIRWICDNISGTTKKVVFTATAFDYLWRTSVFVLSAVLIIPIPWTGYWYVKWFISQFSLMKR